MRTVVSVPDVEEHRARFGESDKELIEPGSKRWLWTSPALLELSETLRSPDGGDLVCRLLVTILQAVIDAQARRTSARQRTSGRRPAPRSATTPARRRSLPRSGNLTVTILKTWTGSFFQSLLEPRRRIDVALHAVVIEAYVTGTSIRKVDDLVAALGGASGISTSEVSRICASLDEEVRAFRERGLDHLAFPYVFHDATYCKARLPGPDGQASEESPTWSSRSR